MTERGVIHNAETIAPETKVWVDHEVYFRLEGDDRFIVRRRRTLGYALVDWVTVHVPAGRHPWVAAGGTVCKKDGTFSEHRGRTSESVDLPDTDLWIERAQRCIDGTPDA